MVWQPDGASDGSNREGMETMMTFPGAVMPGVVGGVSVNPFVSMCLLCECMACMRPSNSLSRRHARTAGPVVDQRVVALQLARVQPRRIDPHVQVQEGLRLCSLGRRRLELGQHPVGQEAPRVPDGRVGDDGLARPDDPPVAQPHPDGARLGLLAGASSGRRFDQDLLDVGPQVQLAPALGKPADQGVDDGAGASLGIVQHDVRAVPVRLCVCWGVWLGGWVGGGMQVVDGEGKGRRAGGRARTSMYAITAVMVPSGGMPCKRKQRRLSQFLMNGSVTPTSARMEEKGDWSVGPAWWRGCWDASSERLRRE
jgi:hypothetical protein